MRVCTCVHARVHACANTRICVRLFRAEQLLPITRNESQLFFRMLAYASLYDLDIGPEVCGLGAAVAQRALRANVIPGLTSSRWMDEFDKHGTFDLNIYGPQDTYAMFATIFFVSCCVAAKVSGLSSRRYLVIEFQELVFIQTSREISAIELAGIEMQIIVAIGYRTMKLDDTVSTTTTVAAAAAVSTTRRQRRRLGKNDDDDNDDDDDDDDDALSVSSPTAALQLAPSPTACVLTPMSCQSAVCPMTT